MDQNILCIRKAIFQFRETFLKTFRTVHPQKYEQYVFKHLVTYIICICISQDRFRLLCKRKIQLQKVSEHAWNRY